MANLFMKPLPHRPTSRSSDNTWQATKTMTTKPKIWVPGDWNAFFGFGTNILVNLLTLTALLRFVLKMPDTFVFGRILPATGLMMCLSTFYYAFLAYRLAKKTGRTDVCALPSGISVPHVFIVTFVVMLPIALSTKDPRKAWEAGLTWVFVQSFVLMVGGFIAPIIRKITPRAALLGTLAGVSITVISISPALQRFVRMVGGFIAPIIRKITPREALMGTLAAVSITFISMAPALQMFLTPVI